MKATWLQNLQKRSSSKNLHDPYLGVNSFFVHKPCTVPQTCVVGGLVPRLAKQYLLQPNRQLSHKVFNPIVLVISMIPVQLLPLCTAMQALK